MYCLPGPSPGLSAVDFFRKRQERIPASNVRAKEVLREELGGREGRAGRMGFGVLIIFQLPDFLPRPFDEPYLILTLTPMLAGRAPFKRCGQLEPRSAGHSMQRPGS